MISCNPSHEVSALEQIMTFEAKPNVEAQNTECFNVTDTTDC